MFHKIRIKHLGGSMLPECGKGKFVSVYQRGAYTDIVNEGTGDIVRLIPFQPNHGVMVEYNLKLANGRFRVVGRLHCDFQKFAEMAGVSKQDMYGFERSVMAQDFGSVEDEILVATDSSNKTGVENG